MQPVKCRTRGRSRGREGSPQGRAPAADRARSATLQAEGLDTLAGAGGGLLLTPHRLPSGERCFSRIPDKLIAGIRRTEEKYIGGFLGFLK